MIENNNDNWNSGLCSSELPNTYNYKGICTNFVSKESKYGNKFSAELTVQINVPNNFLGSTNFFSVNDRFLLYPPLDYLVSGIIKNIVSGPSVVGPNIFEYTLLVKFDTEITNGSFFVGGSFVQEGQIFLDESQVQLKNLRVIWNDPNLVFEWESNDNFRFAKIVMNYLDDSQNSVVFDVTGNLGNPIFYSIKPIIDSGNIVSLKLESNFSEHVHSPRMLTFRSPSGTGAMWKCHLSCDGKIKQSKFRVTQVVSSTEIRALSIESEIPSEGHWAKDTYIVNVTSEGSEIYLLEFATNHTFVFGEEFLVDTGFERISTGTNYSDKNTQVEFTKIPERCNFFYDSAYWNNLLIVPMKYLVTVTPYESKIIGKFSDKYILKI